jgi:hypothetical protein
MKINRIKNMISLISIYTGGVLTLFMGILHTQYPRMFKWEEDFKKISLVNKKIFYTIHLALILLFFVLGFLSLFYALELSKSIGISFGINLMISFFWLWRIVWQIIYFKGKTMHYLFMGYFFLLFLTYLIPIIVKLAQ